MKIGEVADQLGVTTQTIRNWVKRPALSPLFSDGANGTPGNPADFNEFDVLLLNSIRALMDSTKGNWSETEAQIAGGWREPLMPERAAIVASSSLGGVQLASRAQSAEDRIIVLQQQAEDLQKRLDDEQDKHRGNIERLTREMGDVRSELAETKLLLKLYRKRGRIEGDDS